MKPREANYLFLFVRAVLSALVPVLATAWLILSLWSSLHGNFWPDLRHPYYELLDISTVLFWSFIVTIWWPFQRRILVMSLSISAIVIATAIFPSAIRLLELGTALVLPFLFWIYKVPPRTSWLKNPQEDPDAEQRIKPKKIKMKKNY